MRSTTNWSGREVAGVILGDPKVHEDGTFEWDGPGLPDGTIDDQGNVVTATVGRLVAPQLAPETVPVAAIEKDAGVTKIVVADDEVKATGSKGKVVDLDEVWAKPEEIPVIIDTVIAEADPAT